MKTRVKLSISARSDMGRVRTNNEDAFLVSDLDAATRIDVPVTDMNVGDRGVLLVISDGMGGHSAGEVASAMVVESLRASLSEPGNDPTSLQGLIDSAVKQANMAVFNAATEAEKRGMGATLTAVLIHEKDAYVAEVGDSRGYLLRAGKLRQITRDQSFAQMLVDAGVLTPEQAKDNPRKNLILQNMGQDSEVQVAIGKVRLCRGDRFLLCCDGISNAIEDQELQEIMSSPETQMICDRLIDLANERGGEDNLTAIVAVVGGEQVSPPVSGEDSSPNIEILQEFEGPKGVNIPRRSTVPPPPKAPSIAPPKAPSSPPAPQASAPTSSNTWRIAVVAIVAAVAAVLAWYYLA